MTARIFMPSKNAMQSGKGKTQNWVLEFEPTSRQEVEPLMGWISSSDMNAQVKLRFGSREEAEDYAKREGVAYRVEEPKSKKLRKKSYSENFNADRKITWTH